MFANVLIANRGEIACRIIRTARRMGMQVDRDAHPRRPRRPLHPARRRGPRDRRRRERLSRRSGDHRAGGEGRRRMPASGLRLPVRERRVRRALRAAPDFVFVGPPPGGDAGDGPQEFRQGADAEGGRAGRAGLSRRQSEPEISSGEGLRDRLSRPHQGDRRRRRARHAAGRRAYGVRRGAGKREPRGARRHSATAGC